MSKWKMMTNMREGIKIAKISEDLNKHLKKRCAYCEDLDMGFGDDFPVIDFAEHLMEKHPEKIDPEKVKGYLKLLNK